ncbi:hypothetical protein [Priestia aryabhattai]|uniref:hypothetical protein n=1 Tax=Priestia aryabhattai TaxID=412384 RepID=UPI002041EE2A|nr:hypothetical protein [Priestia aryabhattai]MCM3255571.1 hypothetical protein [Priestia aryabhattai]
MICEFCNQEVKDDYYELSGKSSLICEKCFIENEYKQCSDCGCVDSSEYFSHGYCEGCIEYHDTPEWMNDNGGQEEFMDSYDPDDD